MQLAHGATSLTEAWDAGRDSSQDHFMLGQIQEWFYHDLAGIQNAPDSAGFKKIIINPQPVGDVTWAKASYNSIRGKIVSDWKRDSGKFTLQVTIPANTTATVFVPAKSGTLRDRKRPASGAKPRREIVARGKRTGHLRNCFRQLHFPIRRKNSCGAGCFGLVFQK